MRGRSLIVFLVVGLLVAFLIQNAGLGGGGSFIVAFVVAVIAVWIFEKATASKRPAA